MKTELILKNILLDVMSNCPVHLLEKLVYDDSWFMPYSVYYNSNCPPKLKQALTCLSFIV